MWRPVVSGSFPPCGPCEGVLGVSDVFVFRCNQINVFLDFLDIGIRLLATPKHELSKIWRSKIEVGGVGLTCSSVAMCGGLIGMNGPSCIWLSGVDLIPRSRFG